MNRIGMWGAWVSLVLGVLPAYAGEVIIGTPAVEDNRVTFPISLQGDVAGGVSALDFRFNYDSSMFRPVSVGAGEAALNADKRIEWNVRTPGECIVVMMGMNQTPCQTGKVAEIVLQRTGPSDQGNYRFEVTRPTLSSAEGDIIRAEGSQETVSFPAAGGTSGSETEGKTPGDGTAKPGESAAQRGDSENRSPGSSRTPNSPGWPNAAGRNSSDPGRAAGVQPGAGGQRREPRRTLRGVFDKDRLAAIDKIRAQLPTPEGAPKAETTEESMPAIAPVAAVQPGSPSDSASGKSSTAKGHNRDTSGGTVESSKQNLTTARPPDTVGESPATWRVPRAWAFLGGISAVALAVLLVARARWFT